MTQRVLMYGARGWIGKQVLQILNERKVETIVSLQRLESYTEIYKELSEIKPTHVICTIGRTHGKVGDTVYPTIDYLELTGKLKDNVRDNLYSIMLLAKATEKLGIHMTYLGTGCIFNYPDGTINTASGFNEQDTPNFFGSSYSIVKGFTDQLVKIFDNVLNVRIRMPITAEPNDRDFITKLTKYSKICSIENSMTVLDELLPLMVDMSLKNEVGTINLTNPGVISHNEILQMYQAIVDQEFKWETFSYEEQMKVLKSHRSNNMLDTSKLERLYPNVLNIHDAVWKVLEKRRDILMKETEH